MGFAAEVVDDRVRRGREGSGGPAGKAHRGETRDLPEEGLRGVTSVVRVTRIARLKAGGQSERPALPPIRSPRGCEGSTSILLRLLVVFLI